MCSEGKKNPFYRINCTGEVRQCSLCPQKVCEYHAPSNNEGRVGGHSGCTDFCRTSNPQKCQGRMARCTGCGQPYCARHLTGCQACAGGHTSSRCAVASCGARVVEPCQLCGQHVCLQHAVPHDGRMEGGHHGCSGTCSTDSPEECHGYMQRCPGCARSFCKNHIQQAGRGRTQGGHVCEIHCQTTPIYRDNCAGEISRCKHCQFFFCEYHGKANGSICNLIGGHVCRRTSGAGLSDLVGSFHFPVEPPLLLGQADTVFEGRVFAGGTLGGMRNACVVSFPGKFVGAWNGLVRSSRARDLSSACVFLPKEDPMQRFGKHADDPEHPNRCYCHALCGREREWGCEWFKNWRTNVEDAVRLELTLVVVYFPGKVGEGIVDWEDLADEGDGLWSRPGGLGGSQKGEVAFLRKNGWRFEGIDVDELDGWFGSNARAGGA